MNYKIQNSVIEMGAHNLKPRNPIERYESLSLRESLSKPSLYIFACKELSFILKNSYTKLPKSLQSLVFQETLFAFSVLPEIQTQSAISAANSLLQSAEFALPKQKRALAAAEHKHAVVASKRRSKANQEAEGLTQLPHDVLVHVFSFLDLESLVSSSAVCRSWNCAAGDNQLWKMLYIIFFCNFDKSNGRRTRGVTEIESVDDIDMDWRHAFKTAYHETYCRKFKSRRGYCLNCSSIVWLSSNKCSNKPCIEKNGRDHQTKPVSTQQIVDFILHGSLSPESSSDSDSDDEDVSIYKLWAYPRQFG